MLGQIEGKRKKGVAEDEMAGWHHWLDGLESEWTPGVGDGQGGLVCCNSWGREESDTTEWLNNNKNKNCQPPTLVPPSPSEMALTLSTECFSPNKSTTYLVLCLSLNSFCNERRIWASLNLRPGVWSQLEDHEFSSKTGFWLDLGYDLWIQNPVWVAQFQNQGKVSF